MSVLNRSCWRREHEVPSTDTCVWGGASSELRSAGHDVIWAGEWPDDPGDDEILDRAHREGRMLVTLDKDFGGELAVFSGSSPIRELSGWSTSEPDKQAPACLRVVDLHEEDLKSRAIITVEPNQASDPLGNSSRKVKTGYTPSPFAHCVPPMAAIIDLRQSRRFENREPLKAD